MAKTPKVSHRHHAWCCTDGICVPLSLHDDFERQLGAKIAEFDLFAWYTTRTRERRLEGIVVGDIWTCWREEFRTEMAFRGWVKPRYKPIPLGKPVEVTQMATFGRSRSEIEKHLKDLRDYKAKQAGK